MTTNMYSSLVNIDDASSLDKAHWFTEARGLSLRLLDEEANLEDSAKDARDILETVMQKRLKGLIEQGIADKEAVTRRIALEKRVATWSHIPDWYLENYLEDNAHITLSHYEYTRLLYKRTRENFEAWIEEVLPEFITEIRKQRTAALLAAEKSEKCHEYEDCNPTEVLGKYNNIHWEGVKRSGCQLIYKIRKAKALGEMPPSRIEAGIDYLKELSANRELGREQYNECMALFLRWQGHLKSSLNFIDQATQLKASRIERESMFKMNPIEDNVYTMDMEDAIDMKRDAERLAERHNMSPVECCAMLVEREEF